jgi:carboxyl-terminal processing protease
VAEEYEGDFVGIGVNFYMYKDSGDNRPMRMVLRLKREYKQGIEILYADRTKLFGRKLPSDSLFSS